MIRLAAATVAVLGIAGTADTGCRNGPPSPFNLVRPNMCHSGRHAPLYRHHHRCKQAQGWRLEQREPGVLVWRTPSGRTYATGPTVYVVG